MWPFVEREGWALVTEQQDVASGEFDRRPGLWAAASSSRPLSAVLVAAQLDGITRRANTISKLLQEGLLIRAADMPEADHPTIQVYAAIAKKEGGLISERIRAALAAAGACSDLTARPHQRRGGCRGRGCRARATGESAGMATTPPFAKGTHMPQPLKGLTRFPGRHPDCLAACRIPNGPEIGKSVRHDRVHTVQPRSGLPATT